MTNHAEALAKAMELMIRTHDEPAESLLQEMKEQQWLAQARAALEAYRQAPDGWRDISTAPKDGTDVLVCYDAGSVLVAHIAWWRDANDSLGFTEADVGWWSYTRGSVTQELLNGHREPTHWMPLPQPPAIGGAQ